MKYHAPAFEVVALAFAEAPEPLATTPAASPQDYSVAELKQLSREARTRTQYLQLARFYQARRRMWIQRALGEMDQTGSEPNEKNHRWTDGTTPSAEADRATYHHHLRQAAKAAAHCMHYLRRADLSRCSCFGD